MKCSFMRQTGTIFLFIPPAEASFTATVVPLTHLTGGSSAYYLFGTSRLNVLFFLRPHRP